MSCLRFALLCLALARRAAALQQLATACSRVTQRSRTAVRLDMPVRPPQFGRQEYWDDQYRQEKNFSWYTGWEDLRPFWEELCPDMEARILVPGVGNDAAMVSMYDDGWQRLTLFDYSPEGVRRAAQLFGERPVDLRVADACALPYADAAFDAVLDKARPPSLPPPPPPPPPPAAATASLTASAALRRGHWRRSTSTVAPTPRRAPRSSRRLPWSLRARFAPAAWC